MNTGIRRFILRLIVGLLTFIIGVVAAMALGGFRPFASSPTYIYRRNAYYQSLSPEPAFQRYEYGGYGCRMHHELPPPPMVDAPMPPPPPRSSHY